jgi:hypothetical protein
VRPIIEEIMRAGATSHNAIAQKLNELGIAQALSALLGGLQGGLGAL